MKNRKKDIFQSVAVLFFSLSVAQGGRVTQITPTTGSLLGATKLTIHGEGFAQNQFNEFEKELGNNVTLVSVSRAHVVPCDVISYYTTPYRIVCQTRPSPSGEDSYNIRVLVDGKWLHNTGVNVYCRGECLFKYSETKTPTITSITPKYGLPGSLLEIRGRMFTDQVIETEDFDPELSSIERIFAGADLCEAKDPETDQLYGIRIEDQKAKTGYIKCKPASPLIGSQRVSFLVSVYGRSRMSKDVISVDSQDKLYLFQSHADIVRVSPAVGSTAGGTVLTIKGKGFDVSAKKVSVAVAGVPCEIKSIEKDIFKCQISEAPLADNDEFYPGNRGLLREVRNRTSSFSLSENGGLRNTASEVLPEASSTSFSDRLRGFFVPPSDNNYTFYIQADDLAELYLSANESASAKTKIASCSKPSASWSDFPEQKSMMVSLRKGQYYYLEAVHLQGGGKSHLMVGVKMQNTRHVNSQTGLAVNEKQQILLNSVKRPEIQVINITSWDDGKLFEVQIVNVIISRNQTKGNNTLYEEVFFLSYNGDNTAPLPLNSMTAEMLQCAINNLTSIRKQGEVDVTELVANNKSTSYRVTFLFKDPQNINMLRSNVTWINITRVQKGVPGNYFWKLSLAGRISGNIHINATENDVKRQLLDMIGWHCTYQTPPDRAYYYNGFETPSMGPEYGERVLKQTANCGRFSLKNPKYIFFGGQTKDKWGRILKGYDVAQYKQLCFSYKGKMKDFINFRISYTDKFGADQQSWRKYSIVTIPDGKWHQLCINVHDRVLHDVNVKADLHYKIYVKVISVSRDWKADVSIDDVFIWSDPVMVQRLLHASEPGGNIIEYVDVQSLGPSVWSVSMTPLSCGTDIELLQVADAILVGGNTTSDQAVFRPTNSTEDASISVSRFQAATPPIRGTFDIFLENYEVKGIPANISAEDLKSTLESNFDIGKVSVKGVGTCSSFSWTIEWATTGGDQPAIIVDGNGLTGNNVSIKAVTLDDGGLFLRPIPGDMLRVAERKPQVTVMFDNIPSSCFNRNCSFTFSSSITPTLSTISPQRGTKGTLITLTGSGFSTSAQEVNITIGEALCHITSIGETTLKCTAGQSSGGSHVVVVKVGNKGFAKHVSGQINFSYEVYVSGIKPNRGSIGGGTYVVITGDGFGLMPGNSSVTISGSVCNILSIKLTEITCVTTPHDVSNASVTVATGDKIGTLSNSFWYDSGITPLISSMSSLEGSVSGGEDIFIKGSGFGVQKGTIKIGSRPCEVTLYSDSLIKCTTPTNAPGTYDVLICVDGKGCAVNATMGFRPPKFKYVLEVTGVSPSQGSIFGGTVLTVAGRGFSDNSSAVSVIIGDVPCKVLSSRKTEILCKTDASSTTHSVDNTGIHPEYGIGYAWNPQTIAVNAGDSIKWQWTSPELSGLSYGVQQTRDASSALYDGKGFKSSRSGSGHFAKQFKLPGTYFYSSGAVDPYGAIIMKGKIVVKEVKSKSVDVKVQVGAILAPYNSTSPKFSDAGSSDCQSGVMNATPKCTSTDPLPSNHSSYSFTFWKCSTPEVTSISPNSGTSSTLLTLKGKGFGLINCQNEVKIGSSDCTVQSSAEDKITCLVTTRNQLNSGSPQSVYLRVKNRGFAVIKVQHEQNASFTLQPRIHTVSPQAGSIMGGSILTIAGDGFSPVPEVQVGGAPCQILASSYTQLKCQTAAGQASQVLPVVVKVNGMESNCGSSCTFTYSDAKTPRIDSVTPSVFVGNGNTIHIYGSGLPSKTSDLEIKIGKSPCIVMSSSQYSASCRVGSVVAGKHDLKIHHGTQGFAIFEAGASNMINSLAVLSSITPTEGSIMGGTELSIKGSGFDPTAGHTNVRIGANYCSVVRVTSSEVVCRTSAHNPGSYEVIVTANSITFPRLRYAYRTFITPYIKSVSPARGKGGKTVSIYGSGFSSNTADVQLTVANVSCSVGTSSETHVTCVLGNSPAGIYNINLHVKSKGLAAYRSSKPVTFFYEISLHSISPNDSGLGGGRIVSIKGYGFDSSTVVRICDNVCVMVNSSLNEIYCEVPPYTRQADRPDINCSVSVVGDSDVSSSKSGLFAYRESLTSRITSVTPSRGGTGGGAQLTIKGNGFSPNKDGNKVSIAGIPCEMTYFSKTEIRCTTGPRKGTIKTQVRVEVDDKGIATQDRADFQYIDVWSSPYTWGYKNPPGKGDGVVIPKGQTILLDVDTPVFSFLVIRGELIFYEKDITLNSKKILVVDGGKLQVGTENTPFEHKAKIILHGHLHNKRLPIFGTKVLAVREGTLDLHGKAVPITWTNLARTAVPGDTQLILKHSVTWEIGDKIVLASTSRSQRENEEFNITSLSPDGRTIGITPPVKYRHISIVQTIAGRTVETRAEVGLLTRNVIVEGSENDEWTENIPECPEGFDPGLFAVQTCYQGRYGKSMGSEQFGSQIMINARLQSEGLVTGRISYVEVRKAGQAFGLGRYPIHFHLSGNVSGSYVRGCSIHHTFNRAVTIHGVTGLLVEHNVAYHVMGHAFFIEDGIETGNTIQYNLGVFVQTSSTLLITDVTPATFWVTNPNNTVRHNAAAGGSHHGFWYNLPKHPGGPSFTTSVCPKKSPLGEFQNNTAHSFGRYGLWIFKEYFPMRGGRCDSSVSEPAKFFTLLAYNNLKGFEVTSGGAIQTINFTVIDNSEAGIEFTDLNAPWGENGPLVKDSLVVGHSAVSEVPGACTLGGIVTPQSSHLTVSGTTFVNFDSPSCAALRACSFCEARQGGFTTRFEKIRFVSTPNKAAFKWEHEAVFEDLDGTLTGLSGGGSILPSNPNLPPKHCSQSPSASVSRISGSMCDSTMRFRRMAWNNPFPSSLLYRDALLTNEHGTSYVPWRFMRLTHDQGWMATIILGQNYNFSFDNAPQLTNISYSAVFYEFGAQDYVWMTHPMKQLPDMISTTGRYINMSSGLPSPENASNGDWFYNNETKRLTYIVSGKGRPEVGLTDIDIKMQVYRCFFKNCVKPIPPPPPERRPLEYLRWSDPEAWYGTISGYGGYNKQLPQDGEDVIIQQHWWMVADTEIPDLRKLFIYGTLELEPYMDFVLNATYIVIGEGGNLIIGWEDQPMTGNVLINLNGNWDTPDFPIQGGPNIGSKAIAIFGNLEMHGLNRTVYWTRLSKNADPGSSMIYLQEEVDWKPSEKIVIAPTSYKPYDTEIHTIVYVFPDRKTLQLNNTLKYRHLAESYRTGTWNYSLAAEVGLLTRNIVIKGADDAGHVLEKQSFGSRLLIGSFNGMASSNRRFRMENVEFHHCGQEGWSDYFDPRYCLAFLDVGNLKSSYIRGNSFHDGFNTAIGVFGTHELIVVDNVIHHTVGSSVRVWGTNNKVLRNLAVLSVSPATYKGRNEVNNKLWHASFDISKASSIVLQDNAAAGSERIGFHIRGETCYGDSPDGRWEGNTAHTALHGIHIGYSDGLPECLKIANFVVWKSWDFGVFGFPTSRVILQDTVVVDNNIGILINVWRPPALSHVTADKFVHLDRVLIVGTSPSFDCASDSIAPRNSHITEQVRAPRYKGGGNIGFMLSTFTSGPGLAPEKAWHGINAYPAIRGVVRLNDIAFSSFGTKCGHDSVVFTTNPKSPDAFHPVEARGISLYDVDYDRLVYIPLSNIAWINPSDCIDMDCDGAKHVLIKDLDGTLTGTSGGSIISKAEYEWNGDPRRGLGDYRMPRALLTSPDGSQLNASVVAPHHGIVRGKRAQSFCLWNAAWNGYKCSKLDYHMFIIESLDADTELRRLSPVALSSNGYTDLLNGPMDHGCCFGYACMERISTFFSIVATQQSYTIYFTGTNPQSLRLTLLNANSSQALRVAIRYTAPQRLDVYRAGAFIFPTNAKLDEENFSYKKKDPKLPDSQFEPTLNSISGANYYDRQSQLLYVLVKGNVPVDIRTAPVIQVKLGSRPVHFNDFFEKNLIQNLASLLNIDESRIRVVEIVNAAGKNRRRRRALDDKTMRVTIEIGDPPEQHISYTPEETFSPGNSTSTSPPFVTATTTASPTENPIDQYIGLQSIASKIVEAAQTGHMASSLNLEILSIEVVDPEPPRKLPEGWKRATPEDAGPKNGTWRFDQVEMMKEGNRSNLVNDYLIPARLVAVQQPRGANETVPFQIQPKLVMVDKFNRTVTMLGHSDRQQWYITASIKNGTGGPGALLGGNTTVPFNDGWANFTNLNITHNGTDYVLEYRVSHPSEANFTFVSKPFEVKERVLYFALVGHPGDANETVPFGQQPLVEVRDAATGELVKNNGWKGRKWICLASLLDSHNYKGNLNGSSSVEFSGGVASFRDLAIDHEDNNYILMIKAFTVPSSRYQFSTNTTPFNVKERVLELVITKQPGDCNDTVPCGHQPVLEIRDTATNMLAGNLGWRRRKWTILASMEEGAGNQVLLGQRKFQIPVSGRVEFSNFSFYDAATDYRMKFNVSVSPYSQAYSRMLAISNSFDVKPRKFYLEVVTQIARANQSVPFGTQPVVEVRDMGTGRKATPLKTPWWIIVSLYANPKPGESFLNGTFNVSVVKEQAVFNDVLVTLYGLGYVLKFESSYGHVVLSAAFEVHYVNDYSPVFTSGNRTVHIDEGTVIGSYVMAIHATDNDIGSQGDVYYALDAGNIDSSFHINRTSGVITSARKLDREKTAVYNLKVKAYDGAVEEKVRYSLELAVVHIGDLNDNAPRFTQNGFTSRVNETANLNDVILGVDAMDRDAGANAMLRFSITSGNGDGYFDIKADTGDILVKRSLDLEGSAPPSLNYSIAVHVTDLGSPPLSNSTVVVMNIAPVNEFSPQLTHDQSASITIKENYDPGNGLVLFDVNATDKDFGVQGMVHYFIYSGNSDGKFAIKLSSGVVTLTSSLDYETSPLHRLIIRASDTDPTGGARYTDFDLQVHVEDVNDNHPLFSNNYTLIEVPETLSLGEKATSFLATDLDSGENGRVSYVITSGNSGKSDGYFTLNADTGDLTLQKSLDLESAQAPYPNFTLLVEAKDYGNPQLSNNATYVLKVKEVNEFTPEFIHPGRSLQIPEDTAVGTLLCQVTATDKDFGSDGLITYKIVNGNEDRRFRINSSSGKIFIHAPLDRETKAKYQLEMKASDRPVQIANQRSSVMIVNVSLTDINDNKPVFSKGSYYVAVKETVKVGNDVIAVQASDTDAGSNGQVVYKIKSGNTPGLFEIDSNTGIIKVRKSLDLEAQQHVADLLYTLTVEALDKGQVPQTNEVLVSMEIVSVNEFAPQLQHSVSIYVKIPEDTPVGCIVADINGTDKDFGMDGQLTYSIVAGNEDNNFNINSKTGVIIVNKDLDYETVVRYTLVVRVSDNAPSAQRLSMVAKVTVRLTNVNDSGSVDVLIEDVISKISPPGDPAVAVGVAISSPISVLLLFENGNREKLSDDDSRLTFDDKSESGGLFSVVSANGERVVEANHQGLLGHGVLIVRVYNVYNVRVKINVVGFSSLQLSAVNYPTAKRSNVTLKSLKRIGNRHGNVQSAALVLNLILTDNSTYDVTKMISASFSVVSNDVGVKVVVGPSPRNVLFVERISISGNISLIGKFSGRASSKLRLEILTEVITVNEIVAVEITGLRNQTLVGPAFATQAQVQVDFAMNDSSMFRVQNFSTFPGLVAFKSSQEDVALVDNMTGVVTLLSDYYGLVTVTVTPLQGLAEPHITQFYCNTVPPAGGVDIGQEYGPAIPALKANQKITIPVRVNPGKAKLLAFDVKISFDESQIHFVELKGSRAYSYAYGQLHLADLTNPDNATSHVADLVFDSLVNGLPTIEATVNMLMDQNLGYIGDFSPTLTQCQSSQLGDVNADCVFDIKDAAFALAYCLAVENNFNNEFGQVLLKRTTTKMLQVMDFNLNGVLERNDAYLLARANMEMVRFLNLFHMTVPDHQNASTNCEFELIAELSTRDGTKEKNTDTQLYFELAGGSGILTAQLESTSFNAGELVATYNHEHSLFGGIVKAEHRDESFLVVAKQFQVEMEDLGVSMIQVTKGAQWSEPVVTPLFMFSRDPMFPAPIRVQLAPNAALVVSSGHSPQITVNISESSSTCLDPPVMKNVMFVFQNDFSEVERNKDTFVKTIIKDLTSRFSRVKIDEVRLARGSILVYFDITTQRSQIDKTLVALWDMIKSGYILRVNNTEYQAQMVMRVDGRDYHGNDKVSHAEEDRPTFPTAAVTAVCGVVVLGVITGVAFFFCRKRVRRAKGKLSWKSASKINIIDSYSASQRSQKVGDTEMIMFSGLANDCFESSDNETPPSSRPSSTNTSAQTGNFSKRKVRKVNSASSQASFEAWSENTSPALVRRTPRLPLSSLTIDASIKDSWTLVRPTVIQKSDSQILVQESFSTEGSPINLSPRTPKRGLSPQKLRLQTQKGSFFGSDSSDEELTRNGTPSSADSGTLTRKFLKDQSSRHFIFEKAVLYKRLMAQESPQTGSRDSSHPSSGHSTPRMNVTSLPPGYTGNSNDGNDITVEEESYTVRLPVNVLNTVAEGEGRKPFTKIGFVEFPSDATFGDIREILKKEFLETLLGRVFLFQDAMMADVEPSSEAKTKSMYNLSVIIRFANNQEAALLFCPCGAAAHFHCSACHRRGYCGRDCQAMDWHRHKIACEDEQVSSV